MEKCNDIYLDDNIDEDEEEDHDGEPYNLDYY